MSKPRAKRRRGVLEPTVFAIVGVAILIGFGIWQLDRKVWKENLIATLTTRLARAPENLPPRTSWAQPMAAWMLDILYLKPKTSGQNCLVCPRARPWLLKVSTFSKSTASLVTKMPPSPVVSVLVP